MHKLLIPFMYLYVNQSAGLEWNDIREKSYLYYPLIVCALYTSFLLGRMRGRTENADIYEQSVKRYFDGFFSTMYRYIAKRQLDYTLDHFEELLKEPVSEVILERIRKRSNTDESLAENFVELDKMKKQKLDIDANQYEIKRSESVFILRNKADTKQAVILYDGTGLDEQDHIRLFAKFGIEFPGANTFRYSVAAKANRDMYKNLLLQCIARAKKYDIYMTDGADALNADYVILLNLLKHVYLVDGFLSLQAD